MDIIRTVYYIHGAELMKLIFAVLYVSRTMRLTRCYKTNVFFIFIDFKQWLTLIFADRNRWLFLLSKRNKRNLNSRWEVIFVLRLAKPLSENNQRKLKSRIVYVKEHGCFGYMFTSLTAFNRSSDNNVIVIAINFNSKNIYIFVNLVKFVSKLSVGVKLR